MIDSVSLPVKLYMARIATNMITCAYEVLWDILGIYSKLVMLGNGHVWCLPNYRPTSFLVEPGNARTSL